MKLKPFKLSEFDYQNPIGYTRAGQLVDCIKYVGSRNEGYSHKLVDNIIGIIHEDDGDAWMGFWDENGIYYFNSATEPDPNNPGEERLIESPWDLMLIDEE
jgi:hypothetical protein